MTTTADSGVGSLRSAIDQANLNPNPAGAIDIIEFAIADAGTKTIAVASTLPVITDPVEINGYSQPGSTRNTNPIDAPFNGVLTIVLDGSSAPAGTVGLAIDAGNTKIKGLVIMRFGGAGIRITSNSGNDITGNFIGTDVTGTLDRGNGNDGVQISSVRDNRIGGILPEHRNVIAGNVSDGVEIGGVGSTGNLVVGNFLGTDKTGALALRNDSDGVSIVLSAANNQVGGLTAAERNVIAGNGSDGVEINGAATTGNLVVGNYIGTDLTGTLDLGNARDGVAIVASPGNTVGGDNPAARNVISGNEDDGVDINNAAGSNTVRGNYIGTDATGAADVGNRSDGVSIFNSANTLVGGPTAGMGNVIAGNGSDGIKIRGLTAASTSVQGNLIGLSAGGVNGLGNDGDGVAIMEGAVNSLIGGAGAGNRIGFNLQNGVALKLDAGNGNTILANEILNNGSLGIDLADDGVTANDPPTDADTGPNRLQNFPVLTNAILDAGLKVDGTLDSAPNREFRVEFFANDGGSPASNHGEGQHFLGFITVTTNGAGHVDFTASLPSAVVASGDFITATATDVLSGDTSEFGAPIVFSNDLISPQVMQVLAGGTAWATAFLTHLQTTGQGNAGYAIPDGQAQVMTLPWANINQVAMRFNEDVVIGSADMVLRGVQTAVASASAFAYDDATFTATWTFSSAIGADRWLIDLDDTVTDRAGNALDGEWANPAGGAGGDVFPSGNGTSGGPFQFRFNVLPGDSNRSNTVLVDDVVVVRNAQFKTTLSAGYSALLDLNGSGGILVDDVLLARDRQFTTLPGGEPSAGLLSGSTQAAPTGASAVTRDAFVPQAMLATTDRTNRVGTTYTRVVPAPFASSASASSRWLETWKAAVVDSNPAEITQPSFASHAGGFPDVNTRKSRGVWELSITRRSVSR